MNKLTLRPIVSDEDKNIFISEIQEAFQKAYVEEFGEFEKTILPADDIEESFKTKGSEAYIAEIDGERVGGAIIEINSETGYNSLHLLYVKPGLQNAGNGFKIWKSIEELHPETKIWETHTPYFDKRNIHFYINRCGFKIVEFFNPKHKDPHQTSDTTGNVPSENNYFFRFEKEMK
ncbi:MAG: GNAT family N-acetyltransferase [Oscillospiraceae bacterium]